MDRTRAVVTKRRESGSPRRSTGRAGDPWGYRFVKRLADIVVSLLVIVVLLAPCLVMAAIIALQSKGSPFYTQERVGLGGRHFNLLKFRSMAADADDVERYFTPEQLDQWEKERKVDDDPRITSVGRFLRRTSIDELPQFLNVWKGDMSVVGPRPHMLKHTEEYTRLVDSYMVRHAVKPGITGWAQVNGYRGITDELWKMERRVECDVWYIENWTLLLDIKIMIRTVLNAVHGEKNAF